MNGIKYAVHSEQVFLSICNDRLLLFSFIFLWSLKNNIFQIHVIVACTVATVIEWVRICIWG